MLKSLAYCGILLSGIGFIVLAMIHAQGESVDQITGDVTDAYGDVPTIPDEFGRAPSGQALVASDRAASRLAPPGFDPSRTSHSPLNTEKGQR